MKISFSPPDITETEIEQVTEALRSGWINNGAEEQKNWSGKWRSCVVQIVLYV